MWIAPALPIMIELVISSASPRTSGTPLHSSHKHCLGMLMSIGVSEGEWSTFLLGCMLK
jgi:hypothetical protein